MLMFVCSSVRLFGESLSRALNLHLKAVWVGPRSVPGESQVSPRSVPGQSQVSLRSVSGQSQVSLRSFSGQSQVRLRSVSGQSQVSLRSVSGLKALLCMLYFCVYLWLRGWLGV